jgi:rRNA maturation protein Nop10
MRTPTKSHLKSRPKSRLYNGQPYELIRIEPYTRLHGSDATLLVWRSKCPTCGEAFEVRTPSRARRFEPNRRCQKHKRPGVRVNRRRGAEMRE